MGITAVAAAAAGNYHNIVSQSLSLLSSFFAQPCLVSSPSSLANQTELKALSGPVTPIFNVRDLTGMGRRGEHWYWNWLCATA